MQLGIITSTKSLDVTTMIVVYNVNGLTMTWIELTAY